MTLFLTAFKRDLVSIFRMSTLSHVHVITRTISVVGLLKVSPQLYFSQSCFLYFWFSVCPWVIYIDTAIPGCISQSFFRFFFLVYSLSTWIVASTHSSILERLLSLFFFSHFLFYLFVIQRDYDLVQRHHFPRLLNYCKYSSWNERGLWFLFWSLLLISSLSCKSFRILINFLFI